MSGKIIWSLKELTETLRLRQQNKFDVNIGVSGKRGSGKSTLLFKIFSSFKDDGFNQNEHQVYSREDVMKLLSIQKFGFCWDDEAVNSGYKRDFQDKGQKELIKLVTNFRDNFNIYGSALPFFYSLDKDLRELIFLHIHIIERGLAVLFMPLEAQVHMRDPWDTDRNKKIEEKENKRIELNPKLKFRYNKFSTFAGYLYFSPMTEKQEKIYKRIKDKKRGERFNEYMSNIQTKKELTFQEKVYNALKEGKLSEVGLLELCNIQGLRYTYVVRELNKKLRDEMNEKSVKDFLKPSYLDRRKKLIMKNNLNQIVPDITDEE